MQYLAAAEHLVALQTRCTDLAEVAMCDPYRTADAYRWLDHAEKLEVHVDRLLTLAEQEG